MRPLLLSTIAYVAIAAVIGRQVIAAVSASVAGDGGDPVFTAAILAWNATHLPWSEAWYQFPIFWPTRDTLVLSEHLLGVSVIAAPIQWLTGSPLAAYNATVLLTYPLCGVAMYLLVWRLTGNAAASFLAGLAYAFAPYRAGHIGHIQVLASFWMPLSLLGLHAYLETRRWSWMALFAVTWSLQGAANGYALVYFSYAVALWVAWFLVARGRWRDACVVGASLLVAVLPLAPILYRYVTTQNRLGLARGISEISFYSADIAAPLCAPATLTFWGWLRIACAPEGELFAGAALIGICVLAGIAARGRLWPRVEGSVDRPGRWRTVVRRVALSLAGVYGVITLWTVVAGPWRIDVPWPASASSGDKPATVTFVLLLIGLLLSRWFQDLVRRGSAATFYLLCAAVCWVLAWGPFPRLFGEDVLYQAPYGWLLQLPGVGGLRVPARLWMVVSLCLIVFMGLSLAHALASRSARTARLIVIAAALGLAADGWTTIRAEAVAALPETDLSGRSVLALPIGDLSVDRPAVYHAVTRGYRVVNGYSGYEPHYYEALRALSAAGDGRLFEPFVSRGDLDVLVAREDSRLRSMVERQPDAQLVSEGVVAHYRVPSRRVTPPRLTPAGTRVPIDHVRSLCDPKGVPVMTDGNLGSVWYCGVHEPVQDVMVDLGVVTEVGTIVNALGTNGEFFPSHLRIETSTDGQNWQEAWNASPAASVLHATMAAPREGRVVIEFQPRPARYLRLSQLARRDTYTWAIAELEVWSGEPR